MIVVICFFTVLAGYAQSDSSKYNLLSKRGFYCFPEKGDWAVSINATPFFDYLGGVIGDKDYGTLSDGSTSVEEDAPAFAFTAQNPGSIFFKYFYKDTRALRLKLLFGYTSKKDYLGSGSTNSKEIYLTQNALAIGITLGQEFYRPVKSRIRGYYGYEVGVFATPYEGPLYNDASESVIGKVEKKNNVSSGEDFEETGGKTIGVSGNAFLGVEWFFTPKVSIGGELGLGAKFSKTGRREYKPYSTKIVIDSGGKDFSLAPFASGDFVIHFYF